MNKSALRQSVKDINHSKTDGQEYATCERYRTWRHDLQKVELPSKARGSQQPPSGRADANFRTRRSSVCTSRA